MSKITYSQLAKMLQRMATSYAAGVELRTILRRESETGGTSYREQLHKVADRVSQGQSLAEAMRSADKYFPELVTSIVDAGERGGRLEDAFARLGQHYQNLVTFRNRFFAAIAWPVFEVLVAVFLVGGMMAICDWIYSSVEMEKINWLGMGSTLGNVIAYFVLVTLLLAGLVIVILGTARGWFGLLPMKIARRIPLVGKTIDALSLSRFAWTLSIAENAGMNPLEVARLALRSTENFFYKRLEPAVCQSLQEGKTYYRSLKATQAFPEDLLLHVDNGETAGELAETMDRASKEYQEKAELNLKLLGTIGFVGMLVFVGLLVLGIAVFAMQAYVQMLNSFM